MALKTGARKLVVGVSFVWVAALLALIGWGIWSGIQTQDQLPDLVAEVDSTVRAAVDANPALADDLAWENRLASVGESELLDSVPQVPSADAFWFAEIRGAVVIGYRGTSLAEDECVFAELYDDGGVSTSPGSCSRS